jgi:uncharacterized protein (TIRG00374 family)
MMRPICPHPSFRRLLAAMIVGFTAVVFFGRPGEVVRPWLISRSEQVPLSTQLAAWLLERVLDLLMVLILFGFALTQMDPGALTGPNLRAVVTSGGALALLLGIACVAFLGISAFSIDLGHALVRRLSAFLPGRFRARVISSARGFLDGMRVTGSASALGELLLWTVLEWAIIFASMHLALMACPASAHFRLLDSMVFAGFVAFGSAVQLPGIGGGMQVAAILVATELFGLTLEGASAVAVVVWILTWLTVVPVGAVVAFAEGWKWSALRHAGDPMQPESAPAETGPHP